MNKYLSDFQRQQLEKILRQENLPKLHRKSIEIMLAADEGLSQTEICQKFQCAPATARHWILLTETGKSHEWKEHLRGRPKIVNEFYLARLQELVKCSPRDYGYGFEKWTGQWLAKHLEREIGIKIDRHHVNRLLKKMGLSYKDRKKIIEKRSSKSRIAIEDLSKNNFKKGDRL